MQDTPQPAERRYRFHEAGHAVVAKLLGLDTSPTGSWLHRRDRSPRGRFGRITTREQMIYLAAGAVAEMVFGDVPATEIAGEHNVEDEGFLAVYSGFMSVDPPLDQWTGTDEERCDQARFLARTLLVRPEARAAVTALVNAMDGGSELPAEEREAIFRATGLRPLTVAALRELGAL